MTATAPRSTDLRRAARILAAAVVLAAASVGTAHAGLGTAVEYYNAKINHYFVTAYPEEAAALDAGTNVKGWTRTGGQFTVFTEPADGLLAVCRFFGTPNVGPNSHFYTADAAECAKVKTYPAWTFEGIAFYIPMPVNGQCGGNNPVYRSYYSDQISDANHRFTVDLTAHTQMTGRGDILEGVVMCAPVTDEEREADVVRFLEQATLGPTEALVAEVKAKGIEAWLDEQLALNVTRFTQYPPLLWGVDIGDGAPPCIDDPTPPVTPEKYCMTNRGFGRPVQWEFYRQARGPDQLRLRMAHVWHQIMVVSGTGYTYGSAEFNQRLRDHAFGSFENLLTKYALSPQLGDFQNWSCNLPEHDGIRPNENFARELMQLFTIGVTELNEDGTAKLDGAGRAVATYGQADIATLARILTGFGWPTPPGKTPGFCANHSYYIGDMEPYDERHDAGAKSMLGGRISLPPGGTAMGEFRAAIRALVEHPNTPPFISRQLIQKLVTSSPSPSYVARVVAVFKNNGKGSRGDLAAVTKAILLDPEARGARKIASQYGRLREPAIYMTAMIRALDVTTDGVRIDELAGLSQQPVFNAPTVFNFYPADFTLLGTDVPAPEFGIYSTSEFRNRSNHATDILFSSERPDPGNQWGPRPYVANATGTPSPALAAFLPDAANPDALVERLNRLFLHGAMTAGTRKTIVNAVSKVDAADPLRRVKMALLLILPSVAYQVQK